MASLKQPIISRQPKLEVLEDRLPLSTFTVVNDLSQGPGSLNQAVLDANNNPGPDKIGFNIPGEGPFHLNPGLKFGNDLIVDGFSQPGASPNMLSVGSNAVMKIAVNYSYDTGDKCEIRGLIISGSMVLGSDCIFQGNYFGVDFDGLHAVPSSYLSCVSNCLIGGSEPKDRNFISYLVLHYDNNLIYGNYFGLSSNGLDPVIRGTNWPSQNAIDVDSANNSIGGPLPGQGNVISGYTSGTAICFVGFSSQIAHSDNNIIQGNYIGTNGFGTADEGSSPFLERSERVHALANGAAFTFNLGRNNLIGGLTAGCRNIISNNGAAVYIYSGGCDGNKFQGNYIGCDINQQPLGNQTGVYIFGGAKNNIIGGPEEGAGNIIAYNSAYGIQIDGDQSNGNLIDPNKFHGNRGIGIDLGANGRTANGVPGRPGPNGNQNYPVISKAKYQVVKGVKYVVITGSLHGIKNTVHRLEFFSNATTRAVDAQGQFFLGFAYVKTNATGKSNFSLRFKFQPGRFITSTATDWVLKNTSEFSPAVLRT